MNPLEMQWHCRKSSSLADNISQALEYYHKKYKRAATTVRMTVTTLGDQPLPEIKGVDIFVLPDGLQDGHVFVSSQEKKGVE